MCSSRRLRDRAAVNVNTRPPSTSGLTQKQFLDTRGDVHRRENKCAPESPLVSRELSFWGWTPKTTFVAVVNAGVLKDTDSHRNPKH